VINYSTYEGGYVGVGNLDEDPLFVPGPLGDAYLDLGRPALDAGDPTSVVIAGTTQVDEQQDTGVLDQGFHYPANPAFIRGDCNDDGALDLSDAIFQLFGLFTVGAPMPGCEKSCDANEDGGLDVSDPIYVLTHLFALGASPTAPYPDCGVEASSALGCAEFAACP